MTNKAAERFCKNLRASIGKWKMPEETFLIYLEKLSRWKMPEDLWTRVLSRIIANNVAGELPPLASIYEQLKSVQMFANEKGSLIAHYCFRLNGYEMAVPVWRDSDNTWKMMRSHKNEDEKGWTMKRSENPFVAPAGATDVGLAIEFKHLDIRTVEAERCDLETGRNWFMKGWIESGADPAKCEEMFSTLTKGRP